MAHSIIENTKIDAHLMNENGGSHVYLYRLRERDMSLTRPGDVDGS